MFCLKEIYSSIYKKFKERNFSSPQIETELILTKSLNLTKEQIYTYPQILLSKKQIDCINRNLLYRLNHKPIAYIFKNKEFFGLNFYVDENVLIPRQETEFLVEEAIKLIKTKKLYSVADIGTGSGNIIISVIKNLDVDFEKYKFYATDISEKVLDIAKKNARYHNVETKIKFLLTDKLKYFVDNRLKLDIILSNPPYVSEKEYKDLQKEIYYEPKLALVSSTGLEFYEHFAFYGKKVLAYNGYFVFEINSNLLNEIIFLFEKNKYKVIKVVNDYQNLPRVIVIKNNYGKIYNRRWDKT
ncbi:MAG: peptide chain release factor N(5)-glutamine methyltransferase [Endomicrobiia bacterium]